MNLSHGEPGCGERAAGTDKRVPAAVSVGSVAAVFAVNIVILLGVQLLIEREQDETRAGPTTETPTGPISRVT